MAGSVNLVVELGIVLVILMGWQFAAAEFVGGAIMILLLSAMGGLVLRSSLVDAARRRLTIGATGSDPNQQAMVGIAQERQRELEGARWR